ncbi:hypothetical protein B4Q13_22030, partial [Lacticaseibacillus rhamnosus]
ARFNHAMAYDSVRHVVVMTGGFSTVRHDDTWEYDGTTWTQRTGTPFVARSSHGMAFDASRNRMVIFGGFGGSPLQRLADAAAVFAAKRKLCAEYGFVGVAPVDSGVTDYVGAFAVTAGIGVDAVVKKYEAAHDDYSAIIVKAIADRLAEAFAEYLHAQARKDWGFGDALTNDDLIDEKFRGIRPAFGYPACP